MHLPNLFQSKPKTFDVSSVKYKKPINGELVNKLTAYINLTAKYLSKQGLSKVTTGVFDTNSLIAAKLTRQVLGDQALSLIIDLGTEYTNSLIEACRQLSLNTYLLKRGTAYQAEINSYHYHKSSDINKFYMRFINYHLLIACDQLTSSLVDTFDKSDRLSKTRPEGFYGHFMPFYALYKSELSELAVFLKIPSQITNDKAIPYPDNSVLTWEKIDSILFLLTEKQLSPEEIAQQYNIDLHWLKKLKSHVDKQLFQTTVSQFII